MPFIQDLIHFFNELSTDQWQRLFAISLTLIVLLMFGLLIAIQRARKAPSHSAAIDSTAYLEIQATLLQAQEANNYHRDALTEITKELQAWSEALSKSPPDPHLVTALKKAEPSLDALVHHTQTTEPMDPSTLIPHMDQLIRELGKLKQHLDRPASARHEKSLMHLHTLDRQLKGLNASIKEAEKLLAHIQTLVEPNKSS